ncbi:MAG: cell division protein FtsW [Bdellovibrionaceae bacterium]|nr:cell division protein FtsW [Pseudobdellovibrionaceae bacterium]
MYYRGNKGLLLTILFLLGLGVVQVYSSSFIFAIESRADGLYFFRKQLLYALIGLFTIVTTMNIPWKYFERYGIFIWLGSFGLLALTFVPGIAIKAGGAHRWVGLPLGQRLEPAEFLKYSLPFLMAFFISKPMKILGIYKWPLFFLIAGPCLFLLLKQPDFGSFVICSLILLAMAFSFGLKWKYLLGGIVAALPAVYFLIVNVPYRYARVVSFLDPWSDAENKGFQIIQSMLSYYSGGVSGVGLGQGQGKLFFLPEAHTDFTLSVLAEEMGFIGFFLVLFLFGFIIFKGFQIILHTENVFAKAVGVGVVSAFSMSVLINSGVTLGLFPTKGLSLPFLSYGGSSLVATCFGLGVLLNIDRMTHNSQLEKNFLGI